MSDPLTALRTRRDDPVPGAPEAEFVVRATDVADAAAVLRTASELRLRVLIWGAGTHQDRGDVARPDLVLVTTGIDEVIAYEPDDLTLVVGAGATVGRIDELLAERRQTAVLPLDAADATVGGVVATGLSDWQRLRYGPTRDRVLEVTMATGDGRVVRAGGRVVKNVTGYDIPKLATGSLGSLGVIGSVCLKLWPQPRVTATVTVDDPGAAIANAYRPLAIIETLDSTRVWLGGTEREVATQSVALGGVVQPGLDLPRALSAPLQATVLVRPRLVSQTVDRMRAMIDAVEYQAAHGVGEIRFGADAARAAEVIELRAWVEGIGGSLIRTAGDAIEPWGTPPQSLALQRRVKEAFDPIGVCNPGRLPGGL